MGKGRRRSRGSSDVDQSEAVEVPPVDVDGVRTVAVLTVMWAVGFVILAFRKGSLDANGQGWWLWTCLAGVGLGLLGLEYTRKRRDAIEFAALRAEAADDEPSAAPDPPGPSSATSAPLAAPSRGASVGGSPTAVTRPIDTSGFSSVPGASGQPAADPERHQLRTDGRSDWDSLSRAASGNLPGAAAPGFAEPPEVPGPPESIERPIASRRSAETSDRPALPSAVDRQPPAPSPPAGHRPADSPPADAGTTEPGPSDLLGAVPARHDRGWSVTDDEPLLETTLGGGRRARDYDMTEDIDEVTEGGDDQYRGRRARRSDSA